MDVDLVISGSVMAAEDQRFWQSIDKLLIPESSGGDAGECHVSGDDAIERTRGAFLEEVRAVCGLGRDELCDSGEILEIRVGAEEMLGLDSSSLNRLCDQRV